MDCFDESTGMWLFRSPFGHDVPTDPSADLQFNEHCKKHDEAAVKCLNDIEQVPLKFYPTVHTPLCLCEVS